MSGPILGSDALPLGALVPQLPLINIDYTRCIKTAHDISTDTRAPVPPGTVQTPTEIEAPSLCWTLHRHIAGQSLPQRVCNINRRDKVKSAVSILQRHKTESQTERK